MNAASPIEIAEGSLHDLDSVMGVMDDSFDPSFGEAWTASQCAGMMPMPGVWLMLARDGGKAVGFALGRAVMKEAELLLLAVSSGSQGKGVGKLLLGHFIAAATNRGVEDLHLEVRDGNPAIKLYSGFGFAEVGRRPEYYTGRDGQVYDALTFSKKIAT